jgi:Zn-dependent M32 family carboxypeptidase
MTEDQETPYPDSIQMLTPDELYQELCKVIAELEEYRSIAENIGAEKAVSEEEKAIRERDEARAELEMWRDGNILHQIHRDELEKVERERDEAREEAERLRTAVSRLLNDSWNGPIDADHPARAMGADAMKK